MKKKAIGKPAKGRKAAPSSAVVAARVEDAFAEVVTLIQNARHRTLQTVDTELVGLYWKVGEYISRKLTSAEWGDGVVDELARYLTRTQPGLRGFTRPNLFRMRQFYDAYCGQPKVSALLRQLPWTDNLIILSQSKRVEEREFYLRTAIRERWSTRELERQFRAALFERAVLSPPKVSPLVRQMHAGVADVFKDAYVTQLKAFLIELGRDFCFVGSEHPVQVVVEYSLSRSLSPALIAEYQTQLPDKRLLRAKLHKFYQLLDRPEGRDAPATTKKLPGRLADAEDQA